MGWRMGGPPGFSSLCSISEFGEMRKGERLQANLFSFPSIDSKENFYDNNNNDSSNNNGHALLGTNQVPDIETFTLSALSYLSL